LWTLSRGGVLLSLAGCLLMATGPLFQYLSHHLLVESLQLLAVAWFVLIMSCAPRWNRAFTLAQLGIASSVAMLAKASSPLYCILPALVALAYIFGAGPAKLPWGWKLRSTRLAWLAAVLLGAGTALWYYHNLSAVIRHVAIASSGPIAALWGKEDTFLNSFVYWLGETCSSFFLSPALIAGVILVFSGLACYFLKSGQRQKHFTICCAISVIQIILVLAAFSFGSNRVTRYLLPLSPYFALLIGWGLSHIGKKIVLIFANSIFAVIWVVSAGFGLSIINLNSGTFKTIPKVDTSTLQASVLREIVARTCTDTHRTPYYNLIAIDPSLKGDWLAPAPANYMAAREHIHDRKLPSCSYGYIGDGFLGNDASYSWNSILTNRPRYIVICDPEIYPPSAKTFNQALNLQNFGIIFKKLKLCGRYELLARLSADSGILIFRALQPSTGISSARTADSTARYRVSDRFIAARECQPEADGQIWWGDDITEAAAAQPSMKDIGFGGVFELHALAISRKGKGVKIDVWWKELRHEEANNERYMFFHFLDKSGEIKYNQQIPLFPYDPPDDQKRWRHDATTFNGVLSDSEVTSLAFGIYQPNGPLLLPDKAMASDWEGRRILMRLSSIPDIAGK
jgi:hypothetical protein